MKNKIYLFALTGLLFLIQPWESTAQTMSNSSKFNIKSDLLLMQFDCKTDVDDLQSAAALITLLSDSRYSKINYHAVAGTYGIQEGLYVPPNDLFQLAFGKNWTEANENRETAAKKVKNILEEVLKQNGDIWIADAGQSDFSAELIRMIQADLPAINTRQRIHLVQHSDWNEKVTTPADLEFVKQNSDYQRIADGNVVGNGTPGFRSPEFTDLKSKLKNPQLSKIWNKAIELCNKYNGKDGRYLNEAVAAGGVDFSDLAEVCWILGLQDIKDAEEFFNLFGH